MALGGGWWDAQRKGAFQPFLMRKISVLVLAGIFPKKMSSPQYGEERTSKRAARARSSAELTEEVDARQ
jgi:hypothetical protein